MTTPLARYCAHVLFQSVADGGVLLDTRLELYYGLNAVGARVCALLPQHETFEGLCEELGREYPDADAATLRADVRELLDDLIAHGLLELSEQPTGGGAHVGSSSA